MGGAGLRACGGVIALGRNVTSRCLVVLLAVCLCTSQLVGQSSRNEYEVAAGVAVPTGLLGRNRGAWPLIRASIQSREARSRVRTRLDAEALWMSSDAAPNAGPTRLGSLQAYSVVYNALVGPARPGIAPYALAGAALQWLRDNTPDAYPGGLVGLRIGVGLRGEVARYHVSFEIASQAAVFSSYGSVPSHKIGAYWPVTFGLTF